MVHPRPSPAVVRYLPHMIREVTILNVRPGTQIKFERDFSRAIPLIQSIPGYLDHELGRCLETPHRYVLLVDDGVSKITPSNSANPAPTSNGSGGFITIMIPFQ